MLKEKSNYRTYFEPLLKSGKKAIPKEIEIAVAKKENRSYDNNNLSDIRDDLRAYGRELKTNTILVLLSRGYGYQELSVKEIETIIFQNCFYDANTGVEAQKLFLSRNKKVK